MPRPLFGFVSVLGLLSGAFAVDWNLSGKVVDADGGLGLGQVQVRLAVAGLSTTSNADGSWTIGTVSVRGRQGSASDKTVNSLRLQEGRLKLSIDGADLLGRKLPQSWGIPPADLALAGRSQAAVVDTLVYTKAQYVAKRVSLANSIQQGLLAELRKSQAYPPPPAADFTDTIKGVAIDMVRVAGGTFTLGCDAGTCPADTKPVADVKLSGYHIGKTEVSIAMWNAVMDTNVPSYGGAGGSYTGMTWYDAMEFSCRLSELTGHNYRMTTEAEWEYAAKNRKSALDKIGTGEEWAYNSWNSAHSGGTDPVGINSGMHTQKTRRDAQGAGDSITGRLIRSIEGIGPALRLAISDEMDLPPGYVSPCDLHVPKMGGEPTNSYRDPRWITGSGAHWTKGSLAIGNFDLRVWEDGTARLGSTSGQWFTSNNIAFVFVPSSGTITKFAYIFLDTTQASLISDKSFMSGGYIGRIMKDTASNIAKPTIASAKSGEELAVAAGDDFKMVDMTSIPDAVKKQDPRLLDEGTDRGWFQNNATAGGTHNYRKDIDADEFRFAVIDKGQVTMLANGDWFTVNNTFLRVTHSMGYTADYLYAIDSTTGTFYHNSFQGYERGDFRMFKIEMNNSTKYPSTCTGTSCATELAKGADAPFYATIPALIETGKSTFVPAPCPAGGCR